MTDANKKRSTPGWRLSVEDLDDGPIPIEKPEPSPPLKLIKPDHVDVPVTKLPVSFWYSTMAKMSVPLYSGPLPNDLEKAIEESLMTFEDC